MHKLFPMLSLKLNINVKTEKLKSFISFTNLRRIAGNFFGTCRILTSETSRMGNDETNLQMTVLP